MIGSATSRSSDGATRQPRRTTAFPRSDHPACLLGTIACDGEHSRGVPGRRDRFATIAITRSPSTPSPLVERSSHDVEANAAVGRCRSRTRTGQAGTGKPNSSITAAAIAEIAETEARRAACSVSVLHRR
jgi:hypothetical protein